MLLAFGTGTSIVVVNTYYKGQHDNRPPLWVRNFVFKCLAPMVCMTSTAREAQESFKVGLFSPVLYIFPFSERGLKFDNYNGMWSLRDNFCLVCWRPSYVNLQKCRQI